MRYWSSDFRFNSFEISKDQYEKYSKFCTIEKDNDNSYRVEVNYNAIKAEASLYKNNETIKETYHNLLVTEKDAIIGEIEACISSLKKVLSPVSRNYGDISLYDGNLNYTNKLVRKLKSDYQDLLGQDIVEIKEEISKIEKQFENLQSSPDFQKASKKTPMERYRPKGCMGCFTRLFFLFSIIIVPLLCLVLL